MTYVLQFFLGAAVGSFLKVIADRYDPDRFIIRRDIVFGRSACASCRRTLRWFELIPLLSFLAQKGECRRCKKRLSFAYPLVEIIAGALFVVIPHAVAARVSFGAAAAIPQFFWLLVFLILLLISLIDLRLRLIPDELVIFLGVLAAFLALTGGGSGILGSIIPRIYGAIFAAAFFGALIAATRGKGMGMGDVKFGAALGLLFGWPATPFILMLAFILGAVIGLGMMTGGRATRKTALPFGPFLSLAALIVFLFGNQIAQMLFGGLW